jgi:hypothetical protein
MKPILPRRRALILSASAMLPGLALADEPAPLPAPPFPPVPPKPPAAPAIDKSKA